MNGNYTPLDPKILPEETPASKPRNTYELLLLIMGVITALVVVVLLFILILNKQKQLENAALPVVNTTKPIALPTPTIVLGPTPTSTPTPTNIPTPTVVTASPSALPTVPVSSSSAR